MPFPQDQVDELKQLFPGVAHGVEGSAEYFLIPSLRLPQNCTPEIVDALLCPSPRDGYPSRLFFSQLVRCTPNPNWNKQNERILERNWFAFSFKVRPGLRL